MTSTLTPLSPAERDELALLCASATPGPWEFSASEAGRSAVVSPPCDAEHDFGPWFTAITSCASDDVETANAAFIAASRDALPRLLAERDALAAHTDRAEGTLTRAGWTYTDGAQEWRLPLGPNPSPLLERIDALAAENAKLREALTQCAEWFEGYANGHYAKSDVEKGNRNLKCANYARRTLGSL